jgi:hypothetical protein
MLRKSFAGIERKEPPNPKKPPIKTAHGSEETHRRSTAKEAAKTSYAFSGR